MMATLKVQIEGWVSDHEDDNFAVLDPVYDMLKAACEAGLIGDYNCSTFPEDPRASSPLAEREDPTYEFIVAGLKTEDALGELRRRAYELAGSNGPDFIIDCELD